jgi:hypothetical protein
MIFVKLSSWNIKPCYRLILVPKCGEVNPHLSPCQRESARTAGDVVITPDIKSRLRVFIPIEGANVEGANSVYLGEKNKNRRKRLTFHLS